MILKFSLMTLILIISLKCYMMLKLNKYINGKGPTLYTFFSVTLILFESITRMEERKINRLQFKILGKELFSLATLDLSNVICFLFL